jgi:hypothetical protein
MRKAKNCEMQNGFLLIPFSSTEKLSARNDRTAKKQRFGLFYIVRHLLQNEKSPDGIGVLFFADKKSTRNRHKKISGVLKNGKA